MKLLMKIRNTELKTQLKFYCWDWYGLLFLKGICLNFMDIDQKID